MSVTVGQIGYGSSVEVDDGSSNAFVAFVEATNITVPMQESETVECTNLLSPNRTREYVAGLVSPGEFSFTQRWTKTAYARALALKGVAHNYKIKFPETSLAAFAGLLKKVDCDISLDTPIDMKITVQVTGAVTFTPAA